LPILRRHGTCRGHAQVYHKLLPGKCSGGNGVLNNFIDNTLLDRLNNIVSSDFAHVTYTEAIDILSKADQKFEYPVKWGNDCRPNMKDTYGKGV